MSWHPECYLAETGILVRGSKSKFATRCQAGSKCKFGGTITMQDKYFYQAGSNTYTPNKPQTYNNLQDAVAKLEENRKAAEEEELKLMEDEMNTSQPVSDSLPVIPPVNAIPQDSAASRQAMSDAKWGPKEAAHMADEITGRLKPILVELVKHQVTTSVDRNKMSEDIALVVLDKIASVTSITVKIQQPDGGIKDAGLQHRQFPTLLKAIMARVNVWMAGPSASGKTTAAQNAAKALNLPFRYTGAVGDPYALIGYNDANGKYVRTPFREAWEHGGIFLWDEVDASDPNALLAFNAALANGTAPFPDGCIDKHKDCVLIAAANTWGHGATHEYVGRLKMDAAFLKRFAFLSWDYDDQLELATAPNPTWTKRVQAIRKKVKDKGLRVLVTPRESYLGAQLLAAGIPQDIVEQMTIKSGMTDEQWTQINRGY